MSNCFGLFETLVLLVARAFYRTILDNKTVLAPQASPGWLEAHYDTRGLTPKPRKAQSLDKSGSLCRHS